MSFREWVKDLDVREKMYDHAAKEPEQLPAFQRFLLSAQDCEFLRAIDKAFCTPEIGNLS